MVTERVGIIPDALSLCTVGCRVDFGSNGCPISILHWIRYHVLAPLAPRRLVTPPRATCAARRDAARCAARQAFLCPRQPAFWQARPQYQARRWQPPAAGLGAGRAAVAAVRESVIRRPFVIDRSQRGIRGAEAEKAPARRHASGSAPAGQGGSERSAAGQKGFTQWPRRYVHFHGYPRDPWAVARGRRRGIWHSPPGGRIRSFPARSSPSSRRIFPPAPGDAPRAHRTRARRAALCPGA